MYTLKNWFFKNLHNPFLDDEIKLRQTNTNK